MLQKKVVGWPSACATEEEGKYGAFVFLCVIIKMNMWPFQKLEIFQKVLKIIFLKTLL